MDNQEAIEILTAKVECMRRETSGIDIDCNHRNCDECDLCYKQGTTGDQREALRVAIFALQAQDAKTRKICDTCKHNPPSKKWLCVDCDMREPADRWEPQECQTCKHYDDASEKCGECLELGIDNYEPNEMENSKELSKTQKALDTIRRQEAIDAVRKCPVKEVTPAYMLIDKAEVMTELMLLPPTEPEKRYTKADYIMTLHKEYGCDLDTAEKAHDVALEYLRSASKMKG